MAKFYGTLQGNRGEATRCGSNGIRTSAQSYDGSVIVNLFYNNEGELFVRIETSDRSATYGDYKGEIYRGTFKEFKELLALDNAIKRGEVKITRHRTKKEGK